MYIVFVTTVVLKILSRQPEYDFVNSYLAQLTIYEWIPSKVNTMPKQHLDIIKSFITVKRSKLLSLHKSNTRSKLSIRNIYIPPQQQMHHEWPAARNLSLLIQEWCHMFPKFKNE